MNPNTCGQCGSDSFTRQEAGTYIDDVTLDGVTGNITVSNAHTELESATPWVCANGHQEGADTGYTDWVRRAQAEDAARTFGHG